MFALVISLIVVLAICLSAWAWFMKTDNPGAIDTVWALGIFASGFIYFIIFNASNQISSALGITWLLYLLWACRLSGWLWYTRLRVNHIDTRYEELAKQWQTSRKWAFLTNYMFQGALMFVIALPFFFIAKSDQIDTFNVTILNLLILVALVGESLADFQLYQHKQNNQGICKSGLWRFSRHPNYFFEWCIWVGFAAIAFTMPHGILALLSPALLTWIMFGLTIPITEKNSLEHRGDAYTEYMQHTPMFFPCKTDK